jgi:hypothetical protein
MNWLKYFKTVLILLFIGCWPLLALGQIESAIIGVNGLTCSQCSRSVEMALRKLPFVADVTMNLEHTRGVVHFKNNQNINLNQLAEAPVNAGFSTAYVQLKIDLSAINPGNGCFVYEGKAFYFLQTLTPEHPAVMNFQVIAKGFLPKKELRNYSLKTNGSCLASEKYYLKPING